VDPVPDPLLFFSGSIVEQQIKIFCSETKEVTQISIFSIFGNA
jgi:hypothetical protein